jgi:hypothetical protein
MVRLLPPNHEVGRVMITLQPQKAPQGILSVNLVVLVDTLFLDEEKFVVHEEDVSFPVLSVSVKEMFSSCPSDLLQSRSK